MRIAYMLTSLGMGGAEWQVVALAERMKARGHAIVLVVVLLGLYLLAARGALSGCARREALWLLLGVSLYFLAVSGGTQAVGRYRLPVMLVVCVFAAAGLRCRDA